jgi:hypothetical protein
MGAGDRILALGVNPIIRRSKTALSREQRQALDLFAHMARLQMQGVSFVFCASRGGLLYSSTTLADLIREAKLMATETTRLPRRLAAHLPFSLEGQRNGKAIFDLDRSYDRTAWPLARTKKYRWDKALFNLGQSQRSG